MTQLSLRAGLAAIALALACLLWSGTHSPASAQVETVTARIAVRAASPQVLELCLDLGEPAERLCPEQRRFAHAGVPLQRWYQSERVWIDAQSAARIRVRRIREDRIEFALLLETAGERELLTPAQRYLTPSRLRTGRWVRSSPVELVLLAPAAPIPAIPGAGVPEGAPALELGRRATNFSLPSLDDETELIEFADYYLRTPNAVTVIIFWSSWSPNDSITLTALNQIQSEQNNVRVLGVNIYDQPGDARALANWLELEFTNVRDATGGVAAHYLIGGLPELYFVDARGIYRALVQGAAPTEMIQAAIDQTAAAR